MVSTTTKTVTLMREYNKGFVLLWTSLGDGQDDLKS